jgi:hypothetical protein
MSIGIDTVPYSHPRDDRIRVRVDGNRAIDLATKRHPVCTARKLEVVSLAEPEPLAEPVAAWRPSGLGV